MPRLAGRNAPSRRFLPRLEALETRDCPAAPSLTFSAEILGGTSVRLSGTVTDESPATAVVQFGGAVSTTATPNSAGQYSVTLTASQLGTVTAQATDAEQLTSQQRQATLSSSAPTLTLTRTYSASGSVILTGTVTDEDAAGRTVVFSGAVEDEVVTDSQGHFAFTTLDWDLGTVTASTEDPWGQDSNTPQATLANSAPVISNFNAVHTANYWWTFSGQVSDEHAPGLMVTLTSGIAGVSTQVAVASDGTFTYSVQLQAGWSTGTVTAETRDWWDVASEDEIVTIWE